MFYQTKEHEKRSRLSAAIMLIVGLAAASFAGYAVPSLQTTYAEAQTFFGGKAAKALLTLGDSTNAPNGVKYNYLVDFSQNPLTMTLLTASSGGYRYGEGSPLCISREGSRFILGRGDSIFVCGLHKDSIPHYVASGHNPSWWVNPDNGDEYIIFCSTEQLSTQLIAGKTYMQKINSGKCTASGSRDTLLDNYAFRGGRSLDGRYLVTMQPGHAQIRISPATAIRHATVDTFTYGPNDNGNGFCNTYMAMNKSNPRLFIHGIGGHDRIFFNNLRINGETKCDQPNLCALDLSEDNINSFSFKPNGVNIPTGWNNLFHGLWENNDYFSAKWCHSDAWDNSLIPGRDAIYKISTDKWLPVADAFGCDIHTWVEDSATPIKREPPFIAVGGRIIKLSKYYVDGTGSVTMSTIPGLSMYYTTDGTTPTASSTLYSGAFSVTAPKTVKAVSVEGGVVSAVASLNIIPFRPADSLTAVTTGSLNYDYFKSPTGTNLNEIPDWSVITPTRSATCAGVTSSVRNSDVLDWAVKYTGYINIPADGVWEFMTISDDGSQLFIDTTRVVNNNYKHISMDTWAGLIGLKAGYHPITVKFFVGPLDWWQGYGSYPDKILIKYKGPTDTAVISVPTIKFVRGTKFVPAGVIGQPSDIKAKVRTTDCSIIARQGQVSLHITGAGTHEVKVMDLLGNQVRAFAGKNDADYALPAYMPAGFYLVKAKIGEKQLLKKVFLTR